MALAGELGSQAFFVSLSTWMQISIPWGYIFTARLTIRAFFLFIKIVYESPF